MQTLLKELDGQNALLKAHGLPCFVEATVYWLSKSCGRACAEGILVAMTNLWLEDNACMLLNCTKTYYE